MNEVKKQPVVFLEGKKVNLRPLDRRTDAEVMQRWINDPEVRRNLTIIFPQSLTNEEEYIARMGNTTKEVALGIVIKETGAFIGVMGLHEIDWANRHATTGALIGEKTYWGQGYGTDAKMALLDYAFNTLNLHKVCSRVFGFNKRSLAYNLHCGYTIEGIQKQQIFREGHYRDVAVLGVFKKDWLPIWRRYQKTGSIR
jgi:RimJ/RimL family protein N-acetyltransferase